MWSVKYRLKGSGRIHKKRKIRGRGIASLAKLALPFVAKAARYIIPGLVSGASEIGIKKLISGKGRINRKVKKRKVF